MSEDTRTPAEKAADTRAAKKANADVTSEPGDEVGVGEPATAEEKGAPESGPIVATTPTTEDDGKVEVTLAHPITKDQHKIELGLDPETKCNVHDVIRVSKNSAKRLIDAGYAQVDPEDAEAVRTVLAGQTREQ